MLSKKSIYGRCSIKAKAKLGEESKILPCERVLITTIKDGIERKTWVDGFDFGINNLGEGVYELNAYSEHFDAQAKLSNVRRGQAVTLQIIPK